MKITYQTQMVVSIILEWENAILSELDRTEALLQQVFQQTQSRFEKFEVLILHNEAQVSQLFIWDFLKKAIPGFLEAVNLNFQVVDLKGAHYFELKNKGAELASGEVLIFLDSDIIPQENWLSLILEAHDDYPNALISGHSYIDYSTLVGKAFALAWFFPLPSDQSDVLPVDLIFSNNFLAPRTLMLENPYPLLGHGITRGADVILWKRLKSKGVPLYVHHGAKASHPSPNGIQHIVIRALAEGRDEYRKFLEPEFLVAKPLQKFLRLGLFRSKKVLRSNFKNGNRVGLKWYEMPITISLMLFYYQLYVLGGILAALFPKFTQSKWQI